MFSSRMSFKVLVVVLIVAMLGATSVTAKSNRQEKAPNWKNAKVTSEDIQTLRDSSSTYGSKSLVSDEKLNGIFRNKLSKNKELIDFTGIKSPDLRKAYASSIRIGKSLNKHDVYAVTFESANWSIMATYDIDRDLILDTVFVNHADKSNVIVTDRNVGVLFKGTQAELMTVKSGSAEDVAKIKAKQKNPYIKENSLSEKVTSMLTIEKASAAGGGFCGTDKNGNPLYSSEVCGWVAVPYCAAAGLLGFWPGLVCAAVTMWGCTYQCN